jgi:hypothetical protein
MIIVTPHPQVVCDTLTERDTLPTRPGVKVFCRETDTNYLYDGAWKAVAGGPGGPSGPVSWTDVMDKPVVFPPETHGHSYEAPGAVAAHEAANSHALLHSNALDHSNSLDHAEAHTHPGVYEPANANIQTHVVAAHAPANAQKNSDITKAEVEAVLTGAISSHSHAGGGGQPIGFVILANDTLAQALATNTNTRITVTAARTLTTTVPAAGVRCSVMVLTAATSSYVITFGSGFKPVGTLATGTTTARVFVVNFISNGTNLYETGRTAAMVA